ncbi:bile acid:sodium symporter family protein [Echinicola jeungdonensis]|uniref:Bile acid:sodium symporter family protein n=1 Tax=Echinicola jeungdonensis TaxID=709343 RepID=A0ABV5J529_9BACT|nr:bile acid:sodium symporter family protein [Echinicola jeungdonensis]MDN3669564.1 bile acid:sodium symporter family protein [Echinicola jeungdonensis]
MQLVRKSLLYISGLLLVVMLFAIMGGFTSIWQVTAVGFCVAFSLGMGSFEKWKGYQYTAWIMTAVVAGMIYPEAFLQWGDFDLRNKWVILFVVQGVMFGMGIQMSLRDFSNLATTGKGVLVGLLSQFSIMPLIGFMLTQIFDFDPEIAAGIILMGACSSGLASNVMVYLARANLVLSVTVTAMATMLAPLMTPFWMKTLAGTLIDIEFISMMMSIIKIVLVPIGAALLHDFLKHAPTRYKSKIYGVAAFVAVYLAALPLGLWEYFSNAFTAPALQSLEIFTFFMGAIVFGVLYHVATRYIRRLDQLMPYISMFGIVYFTTVTTAAGRDNLLQVGVLLFMASVIHNGLGYFFGYWLSRLLGLDVNSARSMALEVGLQNGGMASGLAGSMGKLGTVGLAPAVFSPWMNISGSILANYWRKKSLKEEAEEEEQEAKEKIKEPISAE